MLEGYDFCLTTHVLWTTQMMTARQPSEGGFDGIEKVFTAVGLGSASQPQPACRGMLL
jgi:hypothetical protein